MQDLSSARIVVDECLNILTMDASLIPPRGNIENEPTSDAIRKLENQVRILANALELTVNAVEELQRIARS